MQAINGGGSVTVNDNVDDVSSAVAAAQAADYVVLTISNVGQAGEGKDRVTIDLAADQQKLVTAVLAVGQAMSNRGLSCLVMLLLTTACYRLCIVNDCTAGRQANCCCDDQRRPHLH